MAIFGHVTYVYGKFSQYAKIWDVISVSKQQLIKSIVGFTLMEKAVFYKI